MTDKQRILKAIGFYSPLLCEGNNQRFILPMGDSTVWNHSILGLSKLSDLVKLHKDISERHKALQPQKDNTESSENAPAAAKISKEVKATGRLTFEIHCWDDSYRISSDNNKYSQLAAFEIVFQSLRQGIEGEVARLERGLPMTDGMTRTQLQKHQDAMNLIGRYKHQQLLEIRAEMVTAQEQKESKKVPKKKKSGIVIAPANVKLPSMNK